jgi:hypothetical protein
MLSTSSFVPYKVGVGVMVVPLTLASGCGAHGFLAKNQSGEVKQMYC